MTCLRAFLALCLVAAVPATARSQTPPPTWQPRPGTYAVDPHRYQVDQHRQAMDRLRAAADQRESFARQLSLETRLNRQRLDAARQPHAFVRTEPGPPGSVEAERALRLSASDRRRAVETELDQIDAWLDRSRE